MQLTEKIYSVTGSFPKEEIYGLVNQIRRACVSIVSNLAEGASRDSAKDFARFITMAIGSAAELKAQLLVAVRIKYLEAKDSTSLISHAEQVMKMLHSLKRSILTNNQQPTTNN